MFGAISRQKKIRGDSADTQSETMKFIVPEPRKLLDTVHRLQWRIFTVQVLRLRNSIDITIAIGRLTWRTKSEFM